MRYPMSARVPWDFLQLRWAVFERPISNVRHAVWNRNELEAGAFVKRPVSNGCHAVRNRHGHEVFTPLERICANARHAARNRHGFEAGEVDERPLSNGGHAVGNSDGLDIIIADKFGDNTLFSLCVIFEHNQSFQGQPPEKATEIQNRVNTLEAKLLAS